MTRHAPAQLLQQVACLEKEHGLGRVACPQSWAFWLQEEWYWRHHPAASTGLMMQAALGASEGAIGGVREGRGVSAGDQ
jgi:hypothetical protein